MECVKMYYAVIFTLLTWDAVSSGAHLSIKFEGTQPKPIFVGSNVIFNWTFSGDVKKIKIFLFGYRDAALTFIEMTRYTIDSKVTRTTKLFGYCNSVEWLGDLAKNITAFKMNDITESAHQKTFAVTFYFGVSDHDIIVEEKLLISVPAKVNLKVSNTNVTAGDMVTIECDVLQGRPTPSISWYLNGKELTGKNNKYLLKGEEIKHEDTGSYYCMATNDAGSNSSNVVTVTVHKKPVEPGVDSGDEPGDGDNPKTGARSKGLGAGAIIGILLAVLVVIVIVIVLVYVVMKRRGRPATISKSTTANGDETQEKMVSDSANKDQVWL